MPGVVTRPDTAGALRGLRNFQRATVEYVFDRMYGTTDPVRRFLVADEVGLGKTLVARGLIAKVVDKLWDEVDRIDVLYICSNASIARQNVSRLNITDRSDIALPSRITLMPSRIEDLKRSRLNFVSFTPGTSFNLRSSLGTVEERAHLHRLLPDTWKEQPYAAATLFSGYASRATFESYEAMFARQPLNDGIRDQFREELQRQPADGSASLLSRFSALCSTVGRRRNLAEEERRERDTIIGELRLALAATCVEALEPDLIILDEFQRFKNLLDGEDDASALARRLFAYGEARVLLLSATPYKMYTLDDEAGGEDHFADFVQTLSFLHNDRLPTESFKQTLEAYRRELFQYGNGDRAALLTARDAVTAALRRVVVRTERLAVTSDRNGMLKDMPTGGAPLLSTDVDHYLALQRISGAVEGGEAVEYWKSSPYLLNFMDDYDLKRRFEAAVIIGNAPDFVKAVAGSSVALLSRDDVEKYRRIDPANVRLRSLMADLENCGAWDVCWVPPSMPYYESAGPFGGRARRLTKRLIFSAWQVVPKALAALLSYEAERRLWSPNSDGEGDVNARSSREKLGSALRFSLKDGKPSNMSTLGVIYPSFTLAQQYDPMQTSLRLRQGEAVAPPSLEDVLRDTSDRLKEPLQQLAAANVGAPVDERWYWAAPVLLDLNSNADAARRWLAQANLKDEWRRPAGATIDVDGTDEGEAKSDAWYAHVDELRKIVDPTSLGSQPADLPDVIALFAVAGFGVTALRSLARVTGNLARASTLPLRNAAGHVADGLLALFNLRETEAAVQRFNDQEPYWRRAIEYAAAGGVQAVLDEYAHILVDALGQQGRRTEDVVINVSNEISAALRTRTANIGVDYIAVDAGEKRVRMQSTPGAFRTRFAVRFGARATDEGAAGDRDDVVRRAFNSPFWPFVLCSTSVGQEGLDFHQYCHAVVHWNVPSNPVDLEQREGRVHRYKNHAVRKNVAAVHAAELQTSGHADPWRQVFHFAEANRGETSDLIPYWVFAKADGAHIERHMPLFPFSTDSERAVRVRRALAVYRLAFGQSRQEDLVAYLTSALSPEEIENATDLFRIDLSPPPIAKNDESLSREYVDDDVSADLGSVVASDNGRDDVDLDSMRALIDTFSTLHSDVKRDLSEERLDDLLNCFVKLSRQLTTTA